MTRRIVVAGGGITGLAAAWELSADPELTVKVHEGGDRFGGKIHTAPFGDIELEAGADMFLTRTPDALRLCAELGIDDLVHPQPGGASVWWDGALHELPPGLVMGLPVDPGSLAATDLLSDEGRTRALAEPDRPGLPIDGDRAIGPFVTDRFGAEVTDRFVSPLLGAIAAGDVETMSLDAVLPQIAEVARRADHLTGNVAAPDISGPAFAAPRGGMSRLIDELVRQLRQRGVDLRLGTPVDSLDDLDADGVVVASSTAATAELLRSRSPEAADLLAAVPLVSVVFIALAFRRADVPIELRGTGFLVPRDAGLSITAASWASNKWAHLADPERVLVRTAIGHRHDDGVDRTDDAALLAAALDDLRTTTGITAAPVTTRLTRYPQAFPQYDVGHLDRMAAFDAALRRDAPDLAVWGMAHRGVGIPACIAGGRAEARALADRLAR